MRTKQFGSRGDTRNVLIAFPADLLERINAAAVAMNRTRTAEVLLRLEKSFDEHGVMVVSRAPASK